MTDLKSTWVLGEQYAHTDQNATATAVNANTHARPAEGLFSALPAAGNTGALYLCTDVGLILRDNGTTWDRFGGPFYNFTAPPSSGLSHTTLGTATFTADKDARLLTAPSSGTDIFRGEYSTLSPTSGYTAVGYFETTSVAANNFIGGLALVSSSSGSLITFGPMYDTFQISSGWGLAVSKWTNASTFNSVYVGSSIALPSLGGRLPNWLRVRDDSTNRFFEYSFNGSDWLTLYSVGRTDFITPDSVGWGADNITGTTAKLRLRSFAVTSP